ncbi:MAG: hypothetical protein K9K39_09670 [Desulfohalobiaceae bacterium]|nr:hypothetical protein [Desulfohalobiaceae bacterium]
MYFLHGLQEGPRYAVRPVSGIVADLREARLFLEHTNARTWLTSDHYSNYVDLHGRLPDDREALLQRIDACLELDASYFRPFFVGRE